MDTALAIALITGSVGLAGYGLAALGGRADRRSNAEQEQTKTVIDGWDRFVGRVEAENERLGREVATLRAEVADLTRRLADAEAEAEEQRALSQLLQRELVRLSTGGLP